MPVLCNICLGFLHEPPLELTDEGGGGNFEVIALKCGHVFHKLCILQWFGSAGGNAGRGNCPNCQRSQTVSEAVLVYPSFDESTNDLTAQRNKLRKLEKENAHLKAEVETTQGKNTELESLVDDVFERYERLKGELTSKEKAIIELKQMQSEPGKVGSGTELDLRLQEITERIEKSKLEIFERVEQRVKKSSMDLARMLVEKVAQVSGKVDSNSSKFTEELDRVHEKMDKVEGEVLRTMELRLQGISEKVDATNCRALERMERRLDDTKLEVLQRVEDNRVTLCMQMAELKRQNEVGVAKIIELLTTQPQRSAEEAPLVPASTSTSTSSGAEGSEGGDEDETLSPEVEMLARSLREEVRFASPGTGISLELKQKLSALPETILSKIMMTPVKDDDPHYLAPLLLACEYGNLEIAEYLIETCGVYLEQVGIYTDIDDGEEYLVTPLWLAASNGNLPLVKLLVRHGALVNATSDTGSTPVMIATFGGHLEVVRFLVDEVQADISIPNMNGITCLHNSVRWPQVCEFLLSSGADVNIQHPPKKQTPLHFAIQYGEVEAAKLLLAHGADPTLRNENGHDAFEYARVTNEPDIYDLLVSQSQNKQEESNEVVAPSVSDTPPPPSFLFHFSGEFIKAGFVQDGHVHLFQDGDSIPAMVAWSNGEFHFGEDTTKQQQSNRVWKLSECLLSKNRTEPWNYVVLEEHPLLIIITFELLFALLLKKLKVELEKEQRIVNCNRTILAHPFWLSSTQKMQIKNGAEAAGFKEVYLVNELHAAALSFAETRPGKNIMALGVSDVRIEAVIFDHTVGFRNKDSITYFEGEPLAEVVGVRRKNWNSGQREALAEELQRICKTVVTWLQRKSESVNKVVPEEGFLLCENEDTRSFLENRVHLDITQLKGTAAHGWSLTMEGLSALIQKGPKNMDKFLRNKQIWPIHPIWPGAAGGDGGEGGMKLTSISGGSFLPVEHSIRIPVNPGGFPGVKFCEICLLNERYPIGQLNVTERWWREGVIIPTLEINSEGIVQLKDVKFERREDGFRVRLFHTLDYTWETPNLTKEGIQEVREVVKSHSALEFGAVEVTGEQRQQCKQPGLDDDDDDDNDNDSTQENAQMEWFNDFWRSQGSEYCTDN